ncbi:PREDICTED: uncharacterized protein LOC106749897 isoform X2 [Dinoponera quadriceps]|uniref:Uncharacterized protein LOC106749897 isoform X2 n=1 Tax=Dinoponera quadriceps TaxID=609295 RepID=A0A6P3Y375_DINQU|nr:PREDICTED: uncharacterized protein LOC106749897 isoform X2 [Dinoponera quadriceps]
MELKMLLWDSAQSLVSQLNDVSYEKRGLDTMDASEDICAIYFGNQTPCLGGVLALNGKTGDTIWTHWTAHAIFAVDCSVDLTSDKIKDCVISGRGGILQAINGHDGSSIWEIPMQSSTTSLGQQRILDVYDARFLADMDGDGIGDVIASHATQTNDVRTSNMLVISGKSGSVIRNINLPESEQLFIAPQILVHPDGENVFVLATNSQKQAGGLYIVSQGSIFYGDLQLRELYHNTGKGALLQPILVDITSDGIEDIVAAMFNSTIMAYDGLTFEPIWNYTVPNSEVISLPIPGYYNDDDTPDFMVKHQIGAGFPTYYYTVATVVDGRNGQSLLERPMEDSLSSQMSGLSVTVDGYGNDWFLHWSADCLNYEGVKEKYQFLKDQSLVSQTRADLCRLRFNSTLTTKLLALSQHVGPPGVQLYFSEDWKSLEFNNSVDPRQEAERYWDSHPRPEVADPYADIPLVSERSPRVHKNHRKDGIFKHKNNDLLTEIGAKYDSDAVYENFDEFKDHKSRGENDADREAWKHDNKWARDKVQLDKEYGDGVYGGDDDGEQSIDYSQAMMREQRSVASGLMPPGEPSSTSISYGERSSGGLEEVTNMSTETTSSTTSSAESRSSVGETTASTPDTSAFTGETTGLRSTNLDLEVTRMEAFGVTDATYRDTPSTTQPRRVDRHGFPSIFQDMDDEASIEKIFKRESLKNQNRGKDKRKQTLTSVADENYRIRQKRRTRRKSETGGGRSSEINGIQRQPPTGILLPSIVESKGKTSVDLVFSTFWLPSSEVSVILSQADLECIQKALSGGKLQHKKDDDIINQCLFERGVNYRLYQESTDRENTKIALGQMTIYRMKLECMCPEDMLPNQTCRNISLHQSWPAHLGSSGNGHFKPLRRLNI